MRAYQRLFALVFVTGATALAAAIGCSLMTVGRFFCTHSFIVSLRAFGLGYMAAGLSIWLAACRYAGKKPGINPLFDLLAGSGSILLLANLIFYQRTFNLVLMWGGLALNAAALAIGVIVMLVDPVYPCGLAKVWPEGGEERRYSHVPATVRRGPHRHAVAAQDLTRIIGIGPRIQDILYEAGIVSFLGVAHQTPQQLRDILSEYHLKAPIDPSTWPEQAALAAEEAWQELADLQDHLRGRLIAS